MTDQLLIKVEFQAPHGVMRCDMNLKKGMLTAILGNNGIGKSTLFHYFQQKQKKAPFKSWKFSFMQQFPLAPLGPLRGIDYLDMMQELGGERNRFPSGEKNPLIEFLEVKDILYRPVIELSGGENQLLKMLLLFQWKSDCLFLDEPSHYLDSHKLKKLDTLLEQNKKEGVAILLIDHNYEHVVQLADNAYQLSRIDSYILTSPYVLSGRS